MQKYYIPTEKGYFCTNDFNLAMQVLQEELENKREQIQREQENLSSLNEEFTALLDNYIPEDPVKAKYEGGEE